MDGVRIDKWLWAARFYKTRSLACDEVSKHRVQINGQDIKPAREVRVGDTLTVRQGPVTKTIVVRGLSSVRGPAPVAQQLYEETADSIAQRAKQAELNRLAFEPPTALSTAAPPNATAAKSNMHGMSAGARVRTTDLDLIVRALPALGFNVVSVQLGYKHKNPVAPSNWNPEALEEGYLFGCVASGLIYCLH